MLGIIRYEVSLKVVEGMYTGARIKDEISRKGNNIHARISILRIVFRFLIMDFSSGVFFSLSYGVCCIVSMLILQPIEQRHLRMIYSCEPVIV